MGIWELTRELRLNFYWQGLKKDVENVVHSCEIYQRSKAENCKYPGLLQPLSILDEAWQQVSMDFVEGLPKSRGYDTILVIVDRFTKYGHFISLHSNYTTQSIAQLFYDQIYRLRGMP